MVNLIIPQSLFIVNVISELPRVIHMGNLNVMDVTYCVMDVTYKLSENKFVTNILNHLFRFYKFPVDGF